MSCRRLPRPAPPERRGKSRQGAGGDVPDAGDEVVDDDRRDTACKQNRAGFRALPETHDKHDEDGRKGEVEADDGRIAEEGAEQRPEKARTDSGRIEGHDDAGIPARRQPCRAGPEFGHRPELVGKEEHGAIALKA